MGFITHALGKDATGGILSGLLPLLFGGGQHSANQNAADKATTAAHQQAAMAEKMAMERFMGLLKGQYGSIAPPQQSNPQSMGGGTMTGGVNPTPPPMGSPTPQPLGQTPGIVPQGGIPPRPLPQPGVGFGGAPPPRPIGGPDLPSILLRMMPHEGRQI